MKFTMILLASATSAILSIAVSGQNLVINGSFEQGTNGWTFLGSWAIESGRAVIADTGTNFATSLEGNVQPAYQDVPTVPGQIYRISAAAGGNYGTLGIFWGGVLAGNLVITRADGNFYSGQWDVTADGHITQLLLQPPMLPPPQVFFIDTVSVTPVPELASAVLFGAGVLVSAASVLLRKKHNACSLNVSSGTTIRQILLVQRG